MKLRSILRERDPLKRPISGDNLVEVTLAKGEVVTMPATPLLAPQREAENN